jgi:hypothetical protein
VSWLRLDDLFLENRKIAALTDRQLRIHLSAMLYACRHKRSGGYLTPAVVKQLGANPRDVERLVVLHLWDPVDDEAVEEGSYEIHDFESYNNRDVTATERKRRQRDRERDAA